MATLANEKLETLLNKAMENVVVKRLEEEIKLILKPSWLFYGDIHMAIGSGIDWNRPWLILMFIILWLYGRSSECTKLKAELEKEKSKNIKLEEEKKKMDSKNVEMREIESTHLADERTKIINLQKDLDHLNEQNRVIPKLEEEIRRLSMANTSLETENRCRERQRNEEQEIHRSYAERLNERKATFSVHVHKGDASFNSPAIPTEPTKVTNNAEKQKPTEPTVSIPLVDTLYPDGNDVVTPSNVTVTAPTDELVGSSGSREGATVPLSPGQNATAPLDPGQDTIQPSGPNQDTTQPSGPIQNATQPSGPNQNATVTHRQSDDAAVSLDRSSTSLAARNTGAGARTGVDPAHPAEGAQDEDPLDEQPVGPTADGGK